MSAPRITFAELEQRRPLRCPFCRDDVDLQHAVACAGCQTALHPECFEELGRCPTRGCAGELAQAARTDRCVWCFQAQGSRLSPELAPICDPCREKLLAGVVHLCQVIGCDAEVEASGATCRACTKAGFLYRVLRNRQYELMFFAIALAWFLWNLLT